jgi:polysaccharide export outer membrane protein
MTHTDKRDHGSGMQFECVRHGILFSRILKTTLKPRFGAGLSGLSKAARALFCSALLLQLLACSTFSPRETTLPQTADNGFKTALPKKVQEFATPEKIDTLTPHEQFQYRMGPGDIVSIQVWRRPELSQEGIIVSPDGLITVPRIGSIQVIERTPNEVQAMITAKLELLYTKPEVTVRVQEFHNNKAFVLGRVSKPGVINFPGRGTLLEALALAGGIPDQSKETSLTKCAIIRGNDTIIWIDLQDLLRNGNMALNAPVRNNDVIYIPEASDEMVYVLGEVTIPGAIQLKNGMTVLKAIMLAGGMNKYANPEKVFVIRQQNIKGDVIAVDLRNLLEHGDFSQNFALLPNDIVFISSNGMAKFNYALEKILPSMQILNLGISSMESFGVMQELRKKIWGQSGFVNGSSSSSTSTSSGN